jgi:hypothetical protein
MKLVIYYYNAIEGEEELHEDEEFGKIMKDAVIERNGEYWRVIEILTTTAVGDPKLPDSVKVFLEGPVL